MYLQDECLTSFLNHVLFNVRINFPQTLVSYTELEITHLQIVVQSLAPYCRVKTHRNLSTIQQENRSQMYLPELSTIRDFCK